MCCYGPQAPQRGSEALPDLSWTTDRLHLSSLAVSPSWKQGCAHRLSRRRRAGTIQISYSRISFWYYLLMIWKNRNVSFHWTARKKQRPCSNMEVEALPCSSGASATCIRFPTQSRLILSRHWFFLWVYGRVRYSTHHILDSDTYTQTSMPVASAIVPRPSCLVPVVSNATVQSAQTSKCQNRSLAVWSVRNVWTPFHKNKWWWWMLLNIQPFGGSTELCG